MHLYIRDATLSDIDAVIAIERASFSDSWSAPMFRAHLHGDVNIFLIAENAAEDAGPEQRPPKIAGFAVAHTVVSEAELLNLAVHPAMRGAGTGLMLLDTILARCAARGAQTIFLDVRESNTAARALYAKRGFTLVGRRRRYYQRPQEDGLVLCAKLPVPIGNAIALQ